MSSVAPTRLVSQLLQEDPELRDVVIEFVNELTQRLTEFRQAHTQLNWEQLTTLAHRLKGAGGSYGYPDISRVCAAMEHGFRTHQGERFTEWMKELEQLAQAAAAGLTDA